MNYLKKSLLLFFLSGLLYGCSKDDDLSDMIPKLQNQADSTLVEDKIDSIYKFEAVRLLFIESKAKEVNFLKKTKKKREKFNFKSFFKRKKKNKLINQNLSIFILNICWYSILVKIIICSQTIYTGEYIEFRLEIVAQK